MMLNLNTTRKNIQVTKKSTNRILHTLFSQALRILPGACLFLGSFSTAAQNQNTLTDDFSSLNPQWKIGTQKNISFKIYDGKLQMSNTDAQAMRMVRREIPHDPTSDFTIETSINILTAKRSQVVGIVWGYEHWSDYHSFQVTPGGIAQYYYYDNDVKTQVVKKTAGATTVQGNSQPNLIRIEKRNTTINIYLNNVLLVTTNYTGHEGNEIAFILDAGVTIQADYIKVTRNEKPLTPISDAINGFKKENLGSMVNSSCIDYTPVISADGNVLFFSRDECTSNAASQSADVYVSKRNDKKEWTKAEPLSKSINNASANYIISVTPDLNSALVVDTYNPDGTRKGKGISLTNKRNGNWSIPVEQVIKDFKNDNRFVTFFLTTDGTRLLMSIENDESKGELDLFISTLQPDKTWSKPVNMGNVLNTYAQEFSPFMAPDGKTLFFSSKGHAGYGSSDIFVSKRLDDTWLNWSAPKNLGTEINTASFDGYYTLPANGEYAYLVSDQSGSGHEDIFRIKVAASLKPEATGMIIGNVYDAKTKKRINAEISYQDLEKPENNGNAYSSSEDGFKIALPGGNFYGFTGKAKGYLPSSQNIDLKKLKNYTENKVDLYLTPIEAGQTARLNNIFFDVDKATLRKESFTELDVLVNVMKENAAMKIEIGGHTDNAGNDAHNLDLSLRRAQAVMNYLVQKGITKDRLTFKGYGETVPASSNDTEEGKQFNRRVEITIK